MLESISEWAWGKLMSIWGYTWIDYNFLRTMKLVTNCGTLVWVRLKVLTKPLPPDCDKPLCLNTMVRGIGLKYGSDSTQLLSKSGSPIKTLPWKAGWEPDQNWVMGNKVPPELRVLERLTADKNRNEFCYQFKWMTAKRFTVITLPLSKSSAWYTFQILN